MKLEIRNIGAIESANLTIEGLTVLAGSNGSGKTTCVKILNTCIETILNKEIITNDYIEEVYISKVIEFLVSSPSQLGSLRQKIFFPQTRKEIIKHLQPVLDGKFNSLENSLLDLFKTESKDAKNEFSLEIKNFIKTHLEQLKIELNNYKNNYEKPACIYLSNELESYVYKSKNSEIRLITNSGSSGLSFKFELEKISSYKSNITVNDFVESVIFYNQFDLDNIGSFNDGRPNKILQKQDFISTLKEIFNGSIAYDDDGGGHTFKDNYGNNFEMHLVASGINALAPFYRMIDENKIGSNSVFIIDEPETNLHPEWQVKFADILTLLVRNGVTVVVSSHSPIFISALEKYSVKNNIEKATSFYLAEISKTDGKANFRDCTKDVDQLLNTLFAPFHRIVWSFDE